MKRKVMSINKQEVPRGMVLCNSVFRITWDFLTIIFLIYISAITPYIVAFNVSEVHLAIVVIDAVIDLFFILDVGLNFRTGFYPENQTLECLKFEMVADNYLKVEPFQTSNFKLWLLFLIAGPDHCI
jgi:hypothetical protein